MTFTVLITRDDAVWLGYIASAGGSVLAELVMLLQEREPRTRSWLERADGHGMT